MDWKKEIKVLWVLVIINSILGVIGVLTGMELGAAAVGNLVICSIIIATGIICRKVDSLKVK